MRYVDIPSLEELRFLASVRSAVCLSIWLRTTPYTQHTKASRIELRNLWKQATEQIERRIPVPALRSMEESVATLIDDDEFWKFQSESLAVFLTPDTIRTYRLPNHISSSVEVSDRFHVTPLARALSFPYAGYVLMLAQNSARLIEFTPSGAVEVTRESGIPAGLSDAVGRSMPRDPAPGGRLQGAEGQKVLVAQYSRRTDAAVRAYLAGGRLPLVLAAVEHVAAIYRPLNSYPGLLAETLTGNYEHATPGELMKLAMPLVRAAYEREAAEGLAKFEQRRAAGFGLTDLSDVSRAAAQGAVQTLWIDIEQVEYGTVDEQGGLTFGPPSANTYDIVGELAVRVLLNGGEVIGLRRTQMPCSPVAATLRYRPS